MSTKIFNLSLPQSLVEALDNRAKKDYSSRSDYIRKAIVNQLRADDAIENLLDHCNKKGTKSGIKTEQQVYDIIFNK